MRKLITTLCLSFAVLLGSIGSSSALPPCPYSLPTSDWNVCFGTKTLLFGNKYVGEFRNGKGHGHGTQTWTNGHKYVGEWKNGKMHGQGTYTYADGDKYVGEFRFNNWNGHGTYTHADGTIEEGVWENKKFQYAQSASQYRKLKKKR